MRESPCPPDVPGTIGAESASADVSRQETLLTCGRHCIRMLRIDGDSQEELFSYHLAEAPELDREQRERMVYFHSTDDVKPVCGGRQMLITTANKSFVMSSSSLRQFCEPSHLRPDGTTRIRSLVAGITGPALDQLANHRHRLGGKVW